jgi:hypothetical protein
MKVNRSIRFDEGQTEKLKALAERYDVPESIIVNWALNALINYVDSHDGHVTLPINFERLWTSAQNTHPHGLNEKGGGYGKNKKARCGPSPIALKTDFFAVTRKG